MDYKSCAQQILKEIGGKDNLISAAHCATRLRLVISDNSKCNKEHLENIDGVKGVFEASGQLQIIIGTGTVNNVYDEFIKAAGVTGATKEEAKQAAVNKAPLWRRAIKVLSDIFVPIIPAIVASGLLMGLLNGFASIYPAIANDGSYKLVSLFSNAAFVFLPVLIAISAAKAFGGNQFLGAVIGMIMIHPDLTNAYTAATMLAAGKSVPQVSVWFGLYNINLVGYQGHVIPIIIAVWVMCLIEKKLHKIVPSMLDLFVTPLVSVLVTGYLSLTIFGPVFSFLESGLLSGIKALITLPYGIGGLICGGVYAPIVVTGLHQMFNGLETGLLSAYKYNNWMPIATAANIAQGAAALAVALKTRNAKTKSMALPSSLSAFLGITEPAIFGVNLRFVKPFACGCIGGAIGGMFASWMGIKATAMGITGLFGIMITTAYLPQYLLEMAISFAVSFGLTMLVYREKKPETITVAAGTEQAKPALRADGKTEISSPLTGSIVALKDVPDATFAEGILGQGVAVQPTEGKVVAPADGVVSTLFETHHAIGLTLDSGEELLIHIGLNTVELEGEGYMAHVEVDDRVTKGQTLITFDIPLIEKKGYKTVTPVIVTNSDAYDVSVLAQGSVQSMQPLLATKKGVQG
ncbi:MAG: glucose PTS transporter subunit IIA [Oscillospiraceae bacterium]|jgi:PTS system sucrose-specific IIC component|nr:glucose PTS transporter subunit IIA [Oscillospiraceae bacterium]